MLPLQQELSNLQKEKERIATTTIDDELAADPKLAEVRGGGPAQTAQFCQKICLLAVLGCQFGA